LLFESLLTLHLAGQTQTSSAGNCFKVGRLKSTASYPVGIELPEAELNLYRNVKSEFILKNKQKRKNTENNLHAYRS
jgi:hypothetical protein